jgi:rSAM/selenodomain-associated transferase 2
MAKTRLSIIIPARNEAARIERVLAHCAGAAEVVVADGGSTDDTRAIAKEFGARVVESGVGRGRQMNAGAQVATGDILLFLHADAVLPPNFVDAIRATLSRPGVSAGAFRLGIRMPGWPYRLIEWGIALRSWLLAMPYGDQGLFLYAETFEAIGGYPETPILEDVLILQRLRGQGRIVLSRAVLETSGRRWRAHGFWRTTFANLRAILQWRLGASPEEIARWYRTKEGDET